MKLHLKVCNGVITVILAGGAVRPYEIQLWGPELTHAIRSGKATAAMGHEVSRSTALGLQGFLESMGHTVTVDYLT